MRMFLMMKKGKLLNLFLTKVAQILHKQLYNKNKINKNQIYTIYRKGKS